MNTNTMELNLDEMELINGGSWNWKKGLLGSALMAVTGASVGGAVGGVPGAVIGGVIGAGIGLGLGIDQ